MLGVRGRLHVGAGAQPGPEGLLAGRLVRPAQQRLEEIPGYRPCPGQDRQDVQTEELATRRSLEPALAPQQQSTWSELQR